MCGPTGELAVYLEAILSSSRSLDTVDTGDLAAALHFRVFSLKKCFF